MARKRFAFSNLFGRIFFGYALFGDENEYAGIYQKRNSAGQKKHIKMLMYWPSNPRTEPQQARRQLFSDGVVAWHALSPEDVLYWKKEGQKKRITGYHAFLSNYLLTH